jgi:hypothetical protein
MHEATSGHLKWPLVMSPSDSQPSGADTAAPVLQGDHGTRRVMKERLARRREPYLWWLGRLQPTGDAEEIMRQTGMFPAVADLFRPLPGFTSPSASVARHKFVD